MKILKKFNRKMMKNMKIMSYYLYRSFSIQIKLPAELLYLHSIGDSLRYSL